MKSLLFNDISEIVENKRDISPELAKDKWQVLSYELGEFKGKMLVAWQTAHPREIKLNFNVKGWHKIYLGLINFGGENSLGIRFLKSGEKTVVNTQIFGKDYWAPSEWAQEVYFTSLNFDEDGLSFFKTDLENPTLTSSLVFVRLVPMTKTEIHNFTSCRKGCVAYHFDNDFIWETENVNPEESLGRIEMLRGFGSDKIMFEMPFSDYFDKSEENADSPVYNLLDVRRKKRYISYINHKESFIAALLNKTCDIGFETYCTYRMEAGDFMLPASKSVFEQFSDLYPALTCRTRDNRKIKALSYAYPQVRKMIIDGLLSDLKYGFDGISLIFHRGVHIAFEKPVLDRVKALYGVDARTLPFSDERLNNVLSEFMTTFMREFHFALKENYPSVKVNAIVYYDTISSKNFGLDVKQWAEEGLVDSISQGLMEHYEDLTDCLNNDGTIDLKKYKKENAKRTVLKRYFSDGNIERIVEGAKSFLDELKDTNTEFMATLTWQFCAADYDVKLMREMKKIGVTKFFSWNGGQKASNLQLLNAEKAISVCSDAERLNTETNRYHRVLSLDGGDISSFNPNWRG